jgi:hypothetical protein
MSFTDTNPMDERIAPFHPNDMGLLGEGFVGTSRVGRSSAVVAGLEAAVICCLRAERYLAALGPKRSPCFTRSGALWTSV